MRLPNFGTTTRSWSWQGAEPPLGAPVPCRVYRIYNPDPNTGGARALVYVGECVDTPNRGPRDRWQEHLDHQPWGDTIITRDFDAAVADGTLVVSTEVYPNKREAKRVEQLAIATEQPLYNWIHNQYNPNQIPKWEAEKQRADRDAANNVPAHLTWAALHGRAPTSRWGQVVAGWKRMSRRDRRFVVRAAAWSMVNIVAAVVVALATALTLLASLVLTVGATAVFLLWLSRPARRKQIRLFLNQTLRWLITAAVVATVLRDLGLL